MTVTVRGTDLGHALECYIVHLLDRAQQEGVRGHIGASTIRRLVARELQESLADWREGQ